MTTNPGSDSKTAQFMQTMACATHSAGSKDSRKGPIQRIAEGMLRDHPRLVSYGSILMAVGMATGLGGLPGGIGAVLLAMPFDEAVRKISKALKDEAAPKSCGCKKPDAPADKPKMM